jgi:hypothetical protein
MLTSVPQLARYLIFSLKLDSDPKKALTDLRQVADGDKVVVGLGKSLALAMGVDIAGLHTFPTYTGVGVEIPSTPFSLWCWLRGEDRGALVHQTSLIRSMLARTFHLKNVIAGNDRWPYGAGMQQFQHPFQMCAVTGDVRVQGLDVCGSAYSLPEPARSRPVAHPA